MEHRLFDYKERCSISYSLIGICIVWCGRFIVVCHIVCGIFHTIGHIFDTIGYAVGHILNAVAYTIDNIINDAAAIVLRLCVITCVLLVASGRIVDILRFVLIIVGCILVSSATYKSSECQYRKCQYQQKFSFFHRDILLYTIYLVPCKAFIVWLGFSVFIPSPMRFIVFA